MGSGGYGALGNHLYGVVMFDIHYSDGILSAIFVAIVGNGVWSNLAINKLKTEIAVIQNSLNRGFYNARQGRKRQTEVLKDCMHVHANSKKRLRKKT